MIRFLARLLHYSPEELKRLKRKESRSRAIKYIVKNGYYSDNITARKLKKMTDNEIQDRRTHVQRMKSLDEEGYPLGEGELPISPVFSQEMGGVPETEDDD